MPELAEVETVRRVLVEKLTGKKITGLDVFYESIIVGDVESFKNNVIGKTITTMSRLGKYLIFNLNEGNIVSHLRMEGKYFYLDEGAELNKHIHVVFHLNDNKILCYQDVRKFGRMEYKINAELYTTHPLNCLGIDPILNTNIDVNLIYNKIIKRNKPLKEVLLDQGIITGLGNIYVDEVLFAARINPHRLANTISLDECKKIVEFSVSILSKAITYKGTTIRSYTSSLGVKGEYQQFLNVHTMDICPICKRKLNKDRIGGRSSYYCNECQK